MRDGNPNARNRRSFLKDSLVTGGAIAGATVLGAPKLFAQTSPSTSAQSSIFASSERLTTGDVAILKFLAAAELIEVGPLDPICGTGWHRQQSTDRAGPEPGIRAEPLSDGLVEPRFRRPAIHHQQHAG